MSNFILFLCLGLLFHQLIGFLVDGKYYFTNQIAPTLNITFGKSSRIIIHAIFTLLCTIPFFYTVNIIFITALFVCLTLLIISYPVRLSNHLVLSWFIFLSILISIFIQNNGSLNSTNILNLVRAQVQLILSLTYFFSAFHKLNKDYINHELSCGWNITNLYLDEIKIRNQYARKGVLYFSIYGVILIEFLLAVFILNPSTSVLIIVLLLHMLWGFLCHVHFSLIIYACLILFIKIDFLLSSYSWAIIICCGIIIGLTLGNSKTYYNSYLSKAMYSVFGIISMFLFYSILKTDINSTIVITSAGIASISFISALVIINNIAPYLGIKTEFSFAMFSNIRPDSQQHLLISKNIINFNSAEYIEIIQVSKLPKYNKKVNWDYDFAITSITKQNMKLSSYFFICCLSTIKKSMSENDILDITFKFNEDYYNLNITSKSNLKELNPIFKSWRMNFYPILLPINKKQPICK